MQVAIASLESNLLRFSVKGYLLSAGMCRLASGEIGAAVNATAPRMLHACAHHGARSSPQVRLAQL
jgi:hypothetical protein